MIKILNIFDEIIKEFLETSSEDIAGCALPKADGTIEGIYPPGSIVPMAVIGASALGLARFSMSLGEVPRLKQYSRKALGKLS